MEVVILPQERKAEWERFAYENENTIAWHIYDWHKILEKTYRMKYYPLAVHDGSSIKGILPLYHVKTRLGKEELLSIPYVVAGGIVADDEPTRHLLLDKAIELSKKHNGCEIILKQYKVKNDGKLRTDASFYNRELDLTKSTDSVWEQIADLNKQSIEFVDTRSVALDIYSRDFDVFCKVLFNHHHRRGIPCVSKSWVKNLLDSGMYTFTLLKKADAVVCATMTKEFKKTVSFPFTCLANEADDTISLAYYMYWKLIKHFRSKGIEIFHSGRIPNTDIADPYRLGWGGDKHQYYYQYYPTSEVKTEHSQKQRQKRELFSACWKRLPKFLARSLGPFVVKQFP
ncbi:hypothetical protein ACFL1X_01960 [Candidatus Hydrogenedentota bacterium]